MSGPDSATKLFHILYSPDLLPQFRQILVSICCEENLDFFTTVETYKKALSQSSPAEEKAKKVAHELISNHLSPDSPIPVNISLRVKKQIKEDINASNFHLKIFDEAQKEVYIMLLQKFIQEQKLQAVYNPKKVPKALTKTGASQNPFSSNSAPAHPRASTASSSPSPSAPPSPSPSTSEVPQAAAPRKHRTVAQLNAALNEILIHDEMLEHFKEVTMRMKNQENLNFWLEVEAYKKIFKDAGITASASSSQIPPPPPKPEEQSSTSDPSSVVNGNNASSPTSPSLSPEVFQKAKAKALDIKKRFLCYGDEPVNLDDTIIQAVLAKMNKENFIPGLFDQGQKMCFVMLRESALTNFLKSDVYLAFEAKKPPSN